MNLLRCIVAMTGIVLAGNTFTTFAQTTLTWKGTTSTDWNTAANWSPAQVPTSVDHVIITSGTIVMPASAVFNVMDWSGADIKGVINIASGATLNINGSIFVDAALTNSGTINWSAGNINLADAVLTGGPFVNLATWNITGNNSLSADNSAGYPTYPNAYVVNSGTVDKTAGTGSTSFGGFTFSSPFINIGTVQVDSGTVEFDSGPAISGTYNATTASTVVQFFHGTYTATNATLTGAGSFLFKGDSLTLVSNTIPNLQMTGGKLFLAPTFQGGNITNLTISGINLVGTNTVTGALNWFNSHLTGAFTVASTGTVTIGGSAVYLDAALTNSGTINWTNGAINVADLVTTGGPLVNLGTWNITCDNFFDAENSSGYPTYPNAYAVNAGLVHKTAKTGGTDFGGFTFGAAFFNTGTVQADSGTIEFDGSGAAPVPISGTYNAATAGAVIQFFHGNYTVTNATVTGPGVVQFKNETLTLATNMIPNLKLVSGKMYLEPSFQGGSITNVTLGGTTLQGTNIVTGVLNCTNNNGGMGGVNTVATGGVLNWTGGDITGALIVSNNGTMVIGGNVLLDCALTNAGTINWTNGEVTVADTVTTAGPVINLATGIFNLQCDNFFCTDFAPGYPSNPNAFLVNQGLIRKTANSGNSEFGFGKTFAVYVKNLGRVEADTGTISFDGGYEDDGVGTLAYAFSGLTGTNVGTINFDVKPTLSGVLNLSLNTRNGFSFSAGQHFTLLNFPSATNLVTCLDGLDAGNGILFEPEFTTNSLLLTAVSYLTTATKPKMFVHRTLGGISLTWPVAFSAWTLVTATNLNVTTWTPISACAGNVLETNNFAAQNYFRLKQ